MRKDKKIKNKKRFLIFSFLRKEEGFSLMETIIYVGILGIIASVATSIFLSVTKVQTEQSAQVEISGQLNFAMQTIQRLIKDSSLIDINPGTPTNSLTLRMKNANSDPTIIYLEDGRIYIKEGASGNPQSITSDKVIVNSLEFKKLTQYPGKDVVQIDLAMSATNKVEGRTITRSLRSAVSRASAAVFDSDLLPGADNAYSVGSSNRWKNASFSGNVGIGVTTLLNKLDIAGGVAIGSYAGVNTAPSNGLIISGNVGIGTNFANEKLRVSKETTDNTNIASFLGTSTNTNPVRVEIRRLDTENKDVTLRLINSAYNKGWEWSMPANSNDLRLANIGTGYPLIIKDVSGNLGLGVLDPTEKLEVAGNIKLSGTTPTYKITNVAPPTASSDVATKGYVDNAASGSSLSVYKSDGTTILGKLADLAPAVLYDFTVSPAGQMKTQARVIYTTRDDYDGRPTDNTLLYSGYVDNFCDFITYIDGNNKIRHFITGDCSNFSGKASFRWYYSSNNCTGTVYIPSGNIFEMAVNSGWEGWGDNSEGTNNAYYYCLSLNHDQKAFWRGGYYSNYLGSFPSCYNNDFGQPLLANRSYQSYREPNGTCVNATGTIYSLIRTPSFRLCGSIATGTGECVIK